MEDFENKVISLANKYLRPYKIVNGQVSAMTCPFCHGGEHNDQYSFYVGLYNGTYYCHRAGCGAKGSFYSLANHFGEKINNDGFKINVHQNTKKLYELPDEETFHPATDVIYKYFESRHISKETVDAFHIMSDDEGNIVFPFYRNKTLTYVKMREPRKYVKGESNRPKEWQLANTEAIPFNMDGVSFKKPLFITEGQIDSMALYEAGITNVISVPSGCRNLEFVTTCWDWFEKFSQIVLFGDNDEPGLEMIHTLLARLGEDRCLVPPQYPEFIFNGQQTGKMCKDANEILYCYGPEQLKEFAELCEPAPLKGVINAADIVYVDPMSIPRVMTNIRELDNTIGGLAQGALTLLSGKRSEGKSTITGELALNAIEQGEKVAFYSGELSAQNWLNWIMLQATERQYLDVRMDDRTGKAYTYVPYEVQQRIRKWIDGKLFLLDNASLEMEDQSEAILSTFTMIARRYAPALFIVDNLMSSISTAEEELKAQTKFSNALKKFATKFRTHVILIAHPRKSKPGERFTNDTVSGSANLTNVSDTVLSIEKPNIRITKNREFGKCGFIQCSYDPANRRIFQTNMGDRTVYSWNHADLNVPLNRVDAYPEFAIQDGKPETETDGQPF